WGTHFVDATHIRNEASTLVTAAALNLIDVEVLETHRAVAEFQKSPKALAEHLIKALSIADQPEVQATLDLETLTDEFMGADAFAGLNEHERDQMSSAYRRVVNEIVESMSEGAVANNVHLLQLEEKGERAEALCLVSSDDILVRLRLVRRADVWYLLEVVQPDPGLHIAAERFGPVIKSIAANRAGKKTTAGGVSDFHKILALSDSDAAKAVAEADRLLQSKPGDQTYRFLKMIALWENEQEEESIKLLTELSNEQPAFAPAIYRLAGVLSEEKPEEAIELYKRYSALEPNDPRGYRDLAAVYESTKQMELAEAAYRKAIAVDPFEIPGYEDLAIFLIRNNRVGEVGALLLAADKYATDNDDMLATILSTLEDDIKLEDAERLAASETQRLKTSVWATLSLSDIYVREKRFREALDLIKHAVQLDPKLAYPHVAMSTAYLKQSRLNEALKAIDQALSLNDRSSSAHYIRASVLARLGRKKEAMTALEKSIELDAETLTWIAEDEDLKSLRSLPAFKKLLRDAKKQTPENAPQ
ncbi:MAG TPA: tetratricopeptide repeat protein, partial [Pyrinomonadaceae bacterium]|nr:tetratricopeptide repeat protein [Pyrinomonadaceae bacterium]